VTPSAYGSTPPAPARVERLAAERFTDLTDVWAVTSLRAMRGEDGTISVDRAQAEMERITNGRHRGATPYARGTGWQTFVSDSVVGVELPPLAVPLRLG
jgi:hypothetical protein